MFQTGNRINCKTDTPLLYNFFNEASERTVTELNNLLNTSLKTYYHSPVRGFRTDCDGAHPQGAQQTSRRRDYWRSAASRRRGAWRAAQRGPPPTSEEEGEEEGEVDGVVLEHVSTAHSTLHTAHITQHTI